MKRVFFLFCFMFITGIVIQAQTVNVTFQVDMTVQIAKGAFVAGTNTVSVRGSFNDWGQTEMTDGNVDGIYDVTIAITQNTNIEYKFFHSGGDGTWEDGSNRQFAVGTSNVVLDPVFFNNEQMPSGNPANVTFEVDMRLVARQISNFTTTRKVKVAGSFTDWQNNAIEMTDANNDTIYNVTTQINSAQLIMYKFIHTDNSGGDIQWESVPDRKHWVVDGDQTISKFWNDTDPNVTLADGNIFFVVDMSVANELGVFNPSVDSVQIRGSFNSWNDSNPDRSLMNQDPGDPNLWFLEIPMIQQVLHETMAYKFYLKNGSGSGSYANGGWEVPVGTTITGDRNRPIIFMGEPDQEAPYSYFENVHTDWVIPAGTTVEVTFSVDMTTASGFNAATDTVYWVPRQPLYYTVNNLPWGSWPRVLALSDPNQDMIYTGTMIINGPSFNAFMYNYGYANGGEITKENADQGQSRVRFIGQNAGPRQFDSPWTMPQDIWTDGDQPEEPGPQGLVNVKDITDGIPVTYSLEQNYPNPFNPSTTIRFTIPQAGLVNISVYTILGEKVGEVLNQEMNVGTFEYTFDASKLSSGVYFYTIKTGSFNASKKMLLLK
jgi:hypothetical protein